MCVILFTNLDHSMDRFLLHSLPLILLSFYATSLLISSATVIPVLNGNKTTTTDPRLALLSFKSLLSDPLRSLASWNDNGSLHYCTWRGVTCGRRHPQQVVALDLASLGLVGPISPLISNLTFLRRLHLPGNQLHGPIPEELGRLSRVRHLNLSLNSLQGEIPTALSRCSFLQVISLNGNKLSGEIPSNLTRCANLQTLSLEDNNLNGRIPPLLGSSTPSLVYVGLWNNSLTGCIPPFLANSSTIQFLYLDHNSLTGGIPPSIGNNTSLTKLDLSSNRLTGGIPPFLATPSRLDTLVLSRNNLTGGIPSSLGNLSSLMYIYLAENNLEGSIPENLGYIPSLKGLGLWENSLSDRIPSSLYNLSTITVLSVAYNSLSGTLPPDLGLTLPNLNILAVSMNQFEGSLPTSLSNASGLELVEVRDNSFGGRLPSNLGSLPNLQILDIGWNQFQDHDWSFLSSLSNCTLLESLGLDDTNMRGALPSSIGHLSTRLRFLHIGQNKMSGTIPAEIGNLVGLSTLVMGENLLVGSIPAAIGKLRNMYFMDLSRNNLSGPIPSAIGNLDQLNKLHMGENELSGSIPTSIGVCKGLELLNLSHNALGGTIPRDLLSLSSLTQYLDLSHNSLTGSLPMEVGQLVNLGVLDVSENQLSGDIPPALGACQHLEKLRMEGNFLQGNIPQSFKGLKGLTELDLSRNNFSGRIPGFLNSLHLESLNLSFNDFEGQVPSGGVFSNASGISVLGNKKLCGGHPKLQLPSCSSHASKRRISPLKVILPAVSVAIFLLLTFIGILYLRRKAGCVGGPSSASSFEGERFLKISYNDIHKATDGFSPTNLVGTGSFGSVYKGKIGSEEENIVAVKVLNLYRRGASKSFTAECEAVRNIRHRNLIKIISICSSVDHRGNDFKALVFEYMPNGSLEKWLHPEVGLERPQPRKLTLIQRLNIAIDVVSALDYLHHSCQPPMVHCDLKPSNILLDNDMMAHVGDFRLTKFLAKSISAASKSSTSSIGIKGSIGYVAPEYGIDGQISTQGDVYSFGILLLEMITRKKPTNNMFKDGLNLRRYVEMAFLEEDVIKILDPQLILGDEGEASDGNIMNESITSEISTRCIYSLIRMGLLCSNDAPRDRMEMKDVANEIHKIKVLFSTAEAHRGGSRV